MTTPELLLIVACVLFSVAGVIRVRAASIDGALVAFGLALLALSPVLI